MAKLWDDSKDNEEITIVGNGDQRRDFTHVNDIVSGLIKLGFSDNVGLYNLGRGHNYSINEIVDMIKKYASKEVKVKNLDQRPGEVQITLANIDKTKKDIGWEPIYNIEEYLKKEIC